MLNRFDERDIGRDLRHRPLPRQQRGARLGGRGGAADDADDLIEVRHRDDEAEQDVRPLARLGELELGAAGDHLFAELDEALDDVAKVQGLRPAAADGEHVGREARLGRRVPPELVQHYLRRRVALQLDDDAHALAARFVANVGDALDPLVLGGFGDLLDEAVLADLVGDCGQDDRLTVAAASFHDVARAHHDRAAPRMVGAARARRAEDQRAGREIGGGDDLDQLLDRDRRILDVGFAGGEHFAEVVRRDVGRHADRDPAGAVDEDIGEARGQDLRLVLGRVVVRLEVDRVLVDVVQQRGGDAGEPRFGVAHRRGRIGVHGAEIALAVDQRHAHRPLLRHAGEGVVDRAVAVRVVFTHDVADEAR
jgi:hypothetical protein